MNQSFEKEPGELFETPKKAWRVGEARPFGALPLSLVSAGQVCWLGLVTLGLVALPHNSALRGVASVAMTLWVFSEAISTPLAMLSARKLSADSTALAARFAAYKGAGKLARLGVISSVSGWALGSVLPKKALAQSATGTILADPSARYAPIAQSLCAFGGKCLETGKRLELKANESINSNPEQLNEIGAWRVARGLTREGKYAEAAKVWLARPFNPQWPARLKEDGEGKIGRFFGKNGSFEQAMEQGELRGDEQNRRFCEKTLGVMRSVRERWAIEQDLEKSAMSAAQEAPVPARSARSRL